MYASVRHPDGRVSGTPLPLGPSWIGSHPDCALRLQGQGVGLRHARLEVAVDGKFGIVDLGCAAGVRVNGERIVTAGPLGPLDLLRVADYEIRISAADAVSPPMAIPVPTAPSSGNVTSAIVQSEIFLAIARRVHQRLIEQLDLRRRDVASMADADLRELARGLLETSIAAERLPPDCAPSTLLEFVIDEALGLGPLEALLADDSVREVMVNGPALIFVERHGRVERAAVRFSGEGALRGIVERIVTPVGRRVDEAAPMVDARLPDGSRVNVVIPPIAIGGTSVTIRRFGRRRLGSADLIESGALDARMLEFLRMCVVHRRNLLVSGGTGSGKTTLLNVLSSLIPREERVVTIEDSAELAFDHPNLVSLETRTRNIEGRGEVSIRDLVRNALRMRPDRIVVGECRGGESLDMLQAMNTGHDGSLTTVHANSPRELLSRLEVMVLMSGVDLPVVAIREQIATSIHAIVHQARFACGARRITHITEVTGLAAGTIQLQDLFRFVADAPGVGGRSRGRHVACGHAPQFYESLAQSGHSLDLALFSEDSERRNAVSS